MKRMYSKIRVRDVAKKLNDRTNLFGIRTRTADSDVERILQVFFSRRAEVKAYRNLQCTTHDIGQYTKQNKMVRENTSVQSKQA